VSIERGTLYVVATPIGNLGDITARALVVLESVDAILAEDTRHSARLLRHFDVKKPLVAVHEHNEHRRTPRLVASLKAGRSMALICDAGTPLISDPGAMLVRAARGEGIPVVPVPGPSALVCALSVAGCPAGRFVFEGFLPPRAPARITRLRELEREPRTLVFYEAPHRILDALRDLVVVFGGDCHAVLARELTKRFETVYADGLQKLEARLRASPEQCQGEFVIIVPAQRKGDDGAVEWHQDTDRTLTILLQELPLKQAVTLAVRLTGARRNDLYRRAVALVGHTSERSPEN
jgi:16S rRNA (cytidine1402-2'-O)-methyltransferase